LRVDGHAAERIVAATGGTSHGRRTAGAAITVTVAITWRLAAQASQNIIGDGIGLELRRIVGLADDEFRLYERGRGSIAGRLLQEQ